MSGEQKIVVLTGGVGSERDVSLASGSSMHQSLQKYFPADLVEINEEKLPPHLDPLTDVIFPAVHGTFGEDGSLQQLLEDGGFVYAGSGIESSRLCMNKAEAKEAVACAGLTVARDLRFQSPDSIDAEEAVNKLGQQMVLKPTDQGSSVALHIISGSAHLLEVLNTLEIGNWMLEERILGREISVGMLHNNSLGIVEIIPEGGVYDYKHKYTAGSTQYKFPAVLDSTVEDELKRATEEAFAQCKCRDFARVDFILNQDGKAYFLEINTIPGLTPTSLLPKSASCAGYNFDQLCKKLIEPAWNRLLQKTGQVHNFAA